MYLSEMHIPRRIAASDSDSNVRRQAITVMGYNGINASESNVHIPGGIADGDGHSLLLSDDKVVGVAEATGDIVYPNQRGIIVSGLYP